MPRLRTSLATVAFVLSACAATPGVGPGPETAMASFRVAFNQQDAAGVASLFKADGKLLPAGQPMVTGTESIRAFWQGAFDAGVSHLEKTPIELTVRGDLAVETSSYVVTFRGQPVAGKDTLVWRRGANNEWRIASDIWNNDK